MMKLPRFLFCTLSALVLIQSLASCASDEPKRRERVPPGSDLSNLSWNRPPKWEGNSRYGQMMPQSR